MTNHLKPIVYSIRQTMHVSSLGKTRIFELIRDKRLDVVRVGRRTLVRADSVDRLLSGD